MHTLFTTGSRKPLARKIHYSNLLLFDFCIGFRIPTWREEIFANSIATEKLYIKVASSYGIME